LRISSSNSYKNVNLHVASTCRKVEDISTHVMGWEC
jgi:hypothetical protein